MDGFTAERKQRFSQGISDDAYRFMGVHLIENTGYIFRVWAPNARSVRLVGDFNYWNTSDIMMQYTDGGIWEAIAPNAKEGDKYKYYIERNDGTFVYKGDPYAFRQASLPDTSSMVWEPGGFGWNDGGWQEAKKSTNILESPVNVYEVHLGSWRRHWDGSYYSYDDMANELVPYVKEMGYTHIELMPLTEYPYDGSWGYQVTGYYAPTHRYGHPEGLMHLIDECHRNGIGVILDWVPAHFPKDEPGLYQFDGSCCYELSDPMMNEHTQWSTRIFDYGRYEVCSFLISSALFWIREYHVDGIRVDAVASMLYLDYGRSVYKPNVFGGNYNLEAIEFFKKLNKAAFTESPGVMMIAEESTAFPNVTKPDYCGGLGFNFKWNMGWMNDMLRYMKEDPLFRKDHHNELTFSLTYAFSENYILPLSHDEVVHCKGSLIGKMPGEYYQKFANLRLLYGYMMAHPGKKMVFMGGELAQFAEWDFSKGLDWFLLDYDSHRMLKTYVCELNHFYREHHEFWDNEQGWDGFKWISLEDRDNSVVAFRRIAKNGDEVICVFNFTPVTREHYRIGFPEKGVYDVLLSSDFGKYWGTTTPLYPVETEEIPMHGLQYSGELTVPPLSATFYKIKK